MESLITVHNAEAFRLADMLQEKGIPFSTKSVDWDFEFYVSPSDMKKAEQVTFLLFGE